jgi:DhnA family fructose-bisphosphate aldolase class Ia
MMGADAVAVHCNYSSRWESEMLQILGAVGADCRKWGMPLVALMYPRKETSDGADYNYFDTREHSPEEFARLVRHAVRIGVELGADIVKTIYTGSPETFKTVIDIAMGVPVVIAGQQPITPLQFLKKVEGAVQAGGAGVAGGRNVYNRGHIMEVVQACGDVIHRNMSAEEAIRAYPSLESGFAPPSTHTWNQA